MRPCQNAMIGWRPLARSLLESARRLRRASGSVEPSAATIGIAGCGDERGLRRASTGTRARIGLDETWQVSGMAYRARSRVPFTKVMRSTNCVSDCALAAGALQHDRAERAGGDHGVRAGGLQLLEAHVADARALLLFLVAEQQPAAGAAAVRVVAVALRLADRRRRSARAARAARRPCRRSVRGSRDRGT